MQKVKVIFIVIYLIVILSACSDLGSATGKAIGTVAKGTTDFYISASNAIKEKMADENATGTITEKNKEGNILHTAPYRNSTRGCKYFTSV